MRIAVVTTSWPAWEGDPSGHFVFTEVTRLEQAGHEVAVLAPPAGGAFGWPGVAARLRERPSRAIDAARWVIAAPRRLQAVRSDRVIAHWAVPCAWPIAVSSAGPSLEVVSHGGDIRLLQALPHPARSVVVEAIVRRAQRWRFVSPSLLEALVAGLDRGTRTRVERISAVQAAAIDLPDVTDAIARRKTELAGLRFGVSVGRLVASKRVDRAIEYAATSGDLDAVVIVGDGPERHRLERLARAKGVDARFVGVVPRREALVWIGAARFLLYTSESEGLSTVVREAEALSTPVLRLAGC